MSQVPPPYDPTTDFSTIAQQPILTTGLPGTQLDAEFTNISTSVDATQDRLSEIQRDDGKLRNGIVETYALAQDVLALLAVNGARPRGLWQPFESYLTGDLVSVPQPSFSATGFINPSSADGLYYFTVPGSPPEYAKDGGDEHRMFQGSAFEIVPGSPTLTVQRWQMIKTSQSTRLGSLVDGAATPEINQQYNATDNSFCGGRVAYLSGNLDYAILWSTGLSRWEIRGVVAGDASATVEFRSTTATDYPHQAAWVAVSNSGTLTVTQSDTVDVSVGITMETSGIAYPWSQPSSWIPMSGTLVDELDYFAQSEELPDIANSTYLSITDHTSPNSFSEDRINWAILGSPASAGNLLVENFTGDGVETQFTLSENPLSENNTQIYLDGVYQNKNTYTVVDGIITFDSAPPNGVEIEVVSGVQVEVAIGSVAAGAIGTTELANDAVTTVKIQDGAITADKLAPDAIGDISLEDGSVTTAKLANSAVTADKLAAGAFTTPKIADNAVTNAKMAAGSVSTANIIDSNVTSAKLGTASVTEAKLGSDSVSTGKIQNNAVTGPKLAVGAAVANIGYSPVNKAGDTMSGTLNMGSNNILACPNVAKVHCVFQTATSGAAGTLVDDHNVTSVTRNGTGVYTVNFSSNVGSANHVTLVTLGARATAEITAKTATSVQITIRGVASGDPTDLTAGTQVNVVVFHS